MKNHQILDLVEALRGNREKVSILFGLLGFSSLGFSIYIFGLRGIFSWVGFSAYIIFTGLFLYTGFRIPNKNAWFARLVMFLNGIQMLLALAGWIWVLYLAQENPGGRYNALVNLPFYSFILFFLITFLITFAILMFSLIVISRKN